MALDTSEAPSTEPSREVVLAHIDLEIAQLKPRREDGWTSQALHVSLVAVLGFIAQSLATASGLSWDLVLPRVLLLHLVWDSVAGLRLAVMPPPMSADSTSIGPRVSSISMGVLSGTRLMAVCGILEASSLVILAFWYAPRAMGWTLTLLVVARWIGIVGLMFGWIALTLLPSLKRAPRPLPQPRALSVGDARVESHRCSFPWRAACNHLRRDRMVGKALRTGQSGHTCRGRPCHLRLPTHAARGDRTHSTRSVALTVAQTRPGAWQDVCSRRH
jgi:hypothetical protein